MHMQICTCIHMYGYVYMWLCFAGDRLCVDVGVCTHVCERCVGKPMDSFLG